MLLQYSNLKQLDYGWITSILLENEFKKIVEETISLHFKSDDKS